MVWFKIIIAGWGIFENYCSVNRKQEPILQEANIQILPEEECETWEGEYAEWNDTIKQCLTKTYSLRGGDKIRGQTLCAKHPIPGIGTVCHGDSGGPLMVKHDGHHVLVGINSAVFGCGLVRFVIAPFRKFFI